MAEFDISDNVVAPSARADHPGRVMLHAGWNTALTDPQIPGTFGERHGTRNYPMSPSTAKSAAPPWNMIAKKLPVGRDAASAEQRRQLFDRFDVNGNGYLSLAEVDKAIRDVLQAPSLFKSKPAVMRAFQAARKASGISIGVRGDYVEKSEFRLLLEYLKVRSAARACARARVRVSVRACVRACVRAERGARAERDRPHPREKRSDLCARLVASASSHSRSPFPHRSLRACAHPSPSRRCGCACACACAFPNSLSHPSCTQSYFELYAGFRRIDASDDRRIEIKEWRKGVAMLSKWGVRLEPQEVDDEFRRIDVNKGGVILFDEFCDWAIDKKLKIDGGAGGASLQSPMPSPRRGERADDAAALANTRVPPVAFAGRAATTATRPMSAHEQPGTLGWRGGGSAARMKSGHVDPAMLE